jgi:hypothetical protein
MYSMNHDFYIDILHKLHKEEFINTWLQSDYKKKPLFIYGDPGVCKTSLSNYILRDYSKIKIDIGFCKSHKSFNSFIDSTIHKYSIKMMFDMNHKKKTLIIDDLNYIQKYDKSLLSDINKWIHKQKTFTNHIIIICNFIDHKKLKELYNICYPIHISFTEHEMLHYTKTYFINNDSYHNDYDLQLLIKKSNNNFHNIIMNLNFYKHNVQKIYNYDKEYDNLKIIDHLLHCNNIYHYNNFYNNEIISLNILENSSLLSNDNLDIIDQIYDHLLLSDHFMNISKYNHHNICSVFQIIFPIVLLKRNTIKQTSIKKIIYNKYISKSIIYIHQNILINNYINITIILNYVSLIESFLNETNYIQKNIIKQNIHSFYNHFNLMDHHKIICKFINNYKYFYPSTKITKNNIFL